MWRHNGLLEIMWLFQVDSEGGTVLYKIDGSCPSQAFVCLSTQLSTSKRTLTLFLPLELYSPQNLPPCMKGGYLLSGYFLIFCSICYRSTSSSNTFLNRHRTSPTSQTYSFNAAAKFSKMAVDGRDLVKRGGDDPAALLELAGLVGSGTRWILWGKANN